MSEAKATNDTILVCVSASPSSAGVINYAARKAAEMEARWFAVYVETPGALMRPNERHAADNLELAERLGAETAILRGRNIAEEVVEFAHRKNVARIIAGKPGHSPRKSIFLKSPLARLVQAAGTTDIEIVSGDPGQELQTPYRTSSEQHQWADYGTGLLLLLAATGLCFLMYPYFHLSNLIMVYLLAVMITAIECGRGPAAATSLLSVLAFDFCFVPPRYSFTVDDAQYIVTFIVMFAVALAISHMAERMRRQTLTARIQERQIAAMHGLSRQLASARGVERIVKIAVEYISEIFDSPAIMLLPDERGKLKVAGGESSLVFQKDIMKQIEISRKAFETGEAAGRGTENTPENEIVYAPLKVADFTLGVVAVRPKDPNRFLNAEQFRLFESLVKQAALSLEVEYVAEKGVLLRSGTC